MAGPPRPAATGPASGSPAIGSPAASSSAAGGPAAIDDVLRRVLAIERDRGGDRDGVRLWAAARELRDTLTGYRHDPGVDDPTGDAIEELTGRLDAVLVEFRRFRGPQRRPDDASDRPAAWSAVSEPSGASMAPVVSHGPADDEVAGPGRRSGDDAGEMPGAEAPGSRASGADTPHNDAPEDRTNSDVMVSQAPEPPWFRSTDTDPTDPSLPTTRIEPVGPGSDPRGELEPDSTGPLNDPYGSGPTGSGPQEPATTSPGSPSPFEPSPFESRRDRGEPARSDLLARLGAALLDVTGDLLGSPEGRWLSGAGLPRAHPASLAWPDRASWSLEQLWDRLHLACLCLESPVADRWRRQIRTAAEDAAPGAVDPAPNRELFPGLTGPIRHPGLDLVTAAAHPEVAVRLGPVTDRYPRLALAASRLVTLLDRDLPLLHCRDGIVAAGSMQPANTAKYRERLLDDLGLVGADGNDVAPLMRADETIWSVFPWPLPVARSHWDLWCTSERKELRTALDGLGWVASEPKGDYRTQVESYDNRRPLRIMGYPGRRHGETLRCLRMYHQPHGGDTTVPAYVMVVS